MYISDFARLGQVSVRMLRHYDELGLLRPDHVDPWTGYRSYSPEQLHVLNRLVALKDLGFTLDQVRRILLEQVGPEELRGMLRLRRIELEDEARAVSTRLMAVESRLRMIEMEHHMSADYVIKSLPAARLVARTATLDPERLGEHIGPMFAAVAEGLAHVPGALATPIATYSITEAGMDVAVGYGYAGDAPAGAAGHRPARGRGCVRGALGVDGDDRRVLAGHAPVDRRQRAHDSPGRAVRCICGPRARTSPTG
jgi:DNA-binding transcriptional MerR regulator